MLYQGEKYIKVIIEMSFLKQIKLHCPHHKTSSKINKHMLSFSLLKQRKNKPNNYDVFILLVLIMEVFFQILKGTERREPRFFSQSQCQGRRVPTSRGHSSSEASLSLPALLARLPRVGVRDRGKYWCFSPKIIPTETRSLLLQRSEYSLVFRNPKYSNFHPFLKFKS